MYGSLIKFIYLREVKHLIASSNIVANIPTVSNSGTLVQMFLCFAKSYIFPHFSLKIYSCLKYEKFSSTGKEIFNYYTQQI